MTIHLLTNKSSCSHQVICRTDCFKYCCHGEQNKTPVCGKNEPNPKSVFVELFCFIYDVSNNPGNESKSNNNSVEDINSVVKRPLQWHEKKKRKIENVLVKRMKNNYFFVLWLKFHFKFWFWRKTEQKIWNQNKILLRHYWFEGEFKDTSQILKSE